MYRIIAALVLVLAVVLLVQVLMTPGFLGLLTYLVVLLVVAKLLLRR